MEMCSRCKKRVAVVFVTRFEGGKTINEGICLKCAKELGIKPVETMMEKMGLSDEDLDRMDSEMSGMLENLGDEDMSVMPEDMEYPEEDPDDINEEDSGHAPAVDFRKIFGPLMKTESDKKESSADEKTGKEKSL